MALEKSSGEIAIMKECGKRLKSVTDVLIPKISVSQSTMEIELLAQKLLKEAGLGISFQTVEGYEYATCLPVNNQAVHTKPSNYKLKDGDVLTVDIGGIFKRYHTDWATTIIVGNQKDARKLKFLAAGQMALDKTLASLQVGSRIGVVGQIMQSTIENAGYKVLRDLTGHGIGLQLHEEPYIPNIAPKNIDSTPKIKEGFVGAIEIIYSESTERIKQTSPDGWSIDTLDGSLAACFEHTVLIDRNGIHILT